MNFANQIIDHCESTNDRVRELGEAGCPHGTWVAARIQEKGRGRLGRNWVGAEGNLFLSVLLRDIPKERLTWTPLMVAVSVVSVLRGLSPALDVQIKWPNDLWLDEKKVGGILCEAVSGKSQTYVIAGIGVNCTSVPEVLDQPVTALVERAPAGLLKIERLAPLVASAVAAVDFSDVRSLYEKWAVFLPGMRVSWGLGSSGVVRGLGEMGELLVEERRGVVKSLYAEDVSVRRG